MIDHTIPSEKSPKMEAAITKITGIDRRAAITSSVCAWCEKPVVKDDFKDEISVKEFTISGLCQTCQDEVFG